MYEYRYHILLIVLFIIFVTYRCYKSYRCKRQQHQVKSLGIIMYGYDECPHTKRMKDVFVSNGIFEHVRYVNVKDPIGKNEFEQLKSTGVPTMYSKTTNKKVIGHVDIKTLIKDLS